MIKFLNWSTRILALLGTLDALYLLIYKITSNDQMCLGSGDCATVNYSSYSEIYGIPISLLGLLVYLIITALSLLENSSAFLKASGTIYIFGLGLAGSLFSAYLTYIEFFVIHAVCPFCITSAVIMTLILILSIVKMFKNQALGG